jgi:hypothetical protein
VRVEPRIDDAGLLGEFPTEFIVEGDAVTILSSATGQYTIETLQEGTATLRASALELGVELEVEVLP